MVRYFSQIIRNFIIITLIITNLAGAAYGFFKGYKFGVSAVCEDISFYHDNGLPIKVCHNKGGE